MKKAFLLKGLLVFMLLLAGYEGMAQRINRDLNRPGTYPKHQVAGSWRYLGSINANHSLERDILRVTGQNDFYRKIKFNVTNAPVNIHRMVVRYENGTSEQISTRFQIPQGGQSRVIDLRGGTRRIKTIEFWYDTKGVFKGKAKISVFGQR